MFPASILSKSWRRKQRAKNPEQTQFVRETMNMHSRNYIAAEARVEAVSDSPVLKNTRRHFASAISKRLLFCARLKTVDSRIGTHFASWKIIPNVYRVPRCTRLTPCRTLTR
jgi:hypothetical protein